MAAGQPSHLPRYTRRNITKVNEQRTKFGLRKYEMTNPRDRIGRHELDDMIFANPRESIQPLLIVLQTTRILARTRYQDGCHRTDLVRGCDSIPNDMTQEDLDEWLQHSRRCERMIGLAVALVAFNPLSPPQSRAVG